MVPALVDAPDALPLYLNASMSGTCTGSVLLLISLSHFCMDSSASCSPITLSLDLSPTTMMPPRLLANAPTASTTSWLKVDLNSTVEDSPVLIIESYFIL